jgi:tetratricopeptide (TPR) repeat protein
MMKKESQVSGATGSILLLLLGSLLALGCNPSVAHAEPDTPAIKEVTSVFEYEFEKGDRKVSPVELTAADGTGLELKLYQSKTVMEGPLAFTELRLTFSNPEDREREGRFRITLPEQAAISRFAMRIDDVWQEAEVVERQAARRAYEDFLHRKQDPALLEKSAGNEFRARIFPIPAKGEKELIISYSQELPSKQSSFRLPLQGLPSIADFEVSLRGASTQDILVQEKDFKPQGDFLAKGLDTQASLMSDGFLLARIQPKLGSEVESPKKLLILVDSSASRALGFVAQQQKIESILAELPTVESVKIAAFDQSIEPIYEGAPEKLDLGSLKERGAFGATDLNKALEWATKEKGFDRLLLVTDGISTAGPTQLSETLKQSKLQRLDVLLVGGIRDADKMKLLVELGLKREGVLLDGDEPAATIAHKLNQTVTSGLDVSLANTDWVWPETLNNVQPGNERLIYAKLSNPKEVPSSLTVGGKEYDIDPLVLGSSPLLSRSGINAQIARLESQLSESDDPEVQEKLSEEIVGLSTTHRVLSDKTALLVLETDADYERFSIDRTALADILVVASTGLELQNRSSIHFPKPVAVKAERKEAGKALEYFKDSSSQETVEGGLALGTAAGGEGGGGEPSPPPAMTAEPPDDSDGDSPTDAAYLMVMSESQPTNRRSTPGYSGVSGLIDVDSNQARAGAEFSAYTSEQPQAREAQRFPGGAPDDEGVVVGDESERESEHFRAGAEIPHGPNPQTGEFAKINELLEKGQQDKALMQAKSWQTEEPGNVLALIALGDCYEAYGRTAEAARVFGSIIDLFPSRADLRRYAGSRLQSLGSDGLDLAIDSFAKAVEQRPDHVSSHRFYAFALARAGRLEEAADAVEAGLSKKYPPGRFRSYERILRDDLGLLAAAWLKQEPDQKKQIYDRLKKYDSRLADEPSLRFILTWETDANDVDFHIRDEKGGHAFYSSPKLPSGGELYGDVTTGYGPECFAIDGKPQASPYELEIHYYSRGPMGYGMGQLEVLKHDGNGTLDFEERPYVVMTDGAYVKLGTVKG